MPDLLSVFGIIAIILTVAALTSGIVERAPVSFPMIFLGIGFMIGKHGLGLIQIDVHNPALETVATLSLSFVLFLDALNIRFNEIRKDWIVPVLSLGPGSLLTMLLVALGAYLLLRFPPLQALLTGAVLSSVDPVLLRDVVRDERIPHSIRGSLKTEAGANDILVLPVLLVLAALALDQGRSLAGWLGLLGSLFILGPLAGFLIGALSSKLMEWVRARTYISREYRALYGIGVLLAAYFFGQTVGGSGFLAVFAAGFATAMLDYDLCDCFLEYGEITSEMAMLLAFLLFGDVLSDLIGQVALLPALAFALATLLVARPVAIGIVLRHVPISRYARGFIGWFGPRGLSSLLFGLLLVLQGVPAAEQILAASGVVVIISVVLHGASAAPLAARYSREVARQTLPEEREGEASGLFGQHAEQVPRITPEELAERLAGEHPPVVLDVRSRSTYDDDPGQVPGSIRVLPDHVAEWAADRPKHREIVTYCT